MTPVTVLMKKTTVVVEMDRSGVTNTVIRYETPDHTNTTYLYRESQYYCRLNPSSKWGDNTVKSYEENHCCGGYGQVRSDKHSSDMRPLITLTRLISPSTTSGSFPPASYEENHCCGGNGQVRSDKHGHQI